MYYKSCSSHWRAVCTYMLQLPQQTALQHLVKFTPAEEKSELIFAVMPEMDSMHALIKGNIYLSQGLKEPVVFHLHDLKTHQK